VKAALVAVAVNIAFKVMLMGPLAQVGLALATSIGAWINLVLVLWFAVRAGLLRLDPELSRSVAKLVGAGLFMAVVLWLAHRPIAHAVSTWPSLRDETALAALAMIGGLVYGGTVFALFGRRWYSALHRSKT
jgi:putative peptidoglycan lipid II flippase